MPGLAGPAVADIVQRSVCNRRCLSVLVASELRAQGEADERGWGVGWWWWWCELDGVWVDRQTDRQSGLGAYPVLCTYTCTAASLIV